MHAVAARLSLTVATGGLDTPPVSRRRPKSGETRDRVARVPVDALADVVAVGTFIETMWAIAQLDEVHPRGGGRSGGVHGGAPAAARAASPARAPRARRQALGVTTTLPICRLDSSRRCASTIRSSGK